MVSSCSFFTDVMDLDRISSKSELVEYLVNTIDDGCSCSLLHRISFAVVNFMLFGFRKNMVLSEPEKKLVFRLGVEVGGLLELVENCDAEYLEARIREKLESLLSKLISQIINFSCESETFGVAARTCRDILKICNSVSLVPSDIFPMSNEAQSAVNVNLLSDEVLRRRESGKLENF